MASDRERLPTTTREDDAVFPDVWWGDEGIDALCWADGPRYEPPARESAATQPQETTAP